MDDDENIKNTHIFCQTINLHYDEKNYKNTLTRLDGYTHNGCSRRTCVNYSLTFLL